MRGMAEVRLFELYYYEMMTSPAHELLFNGSHPAYLQPGMVHFSGPHQVPYVSNTIFHCFNRGPIEGGKGVHGLPTYADVMLIYVL